MRLVGLNYEKNWSSKISLDCPFKVLIGGFLYFKKYVIKGVKKSQRTVSFGFQNIQVLYNTMYMLTDAENVLLAMLRISECHC